MRLITLLSNLFNDGYIDTLTDNTWQEIQSAMRSKKTILMDGGFLEHAIYFIFCDDNMVMVERGVFVKNQKTNPFRHFKLESIDALKKVIAILRKAESLSGKSNVLNLYESFDQIVGVARADMVEPKDCLLQNVTQTRQRVGNCEMFSAFSAVYGASILFSKGQLDLNEKYSILSEVKKNELALEWGTAIYKHCIADLNL